MVMALSFSPRFSAVSNKKFFCVIIVWILVGI